MSLVKYLTYIYFIVYKFYVIGVSIGFTTKLSGTYTSGSDNIRGNQILYNQGSAYSGTVFTCPSPGLYLFQVSLITQKEDGIWIYKNSQVLTYAYSGFNSNFNSGSVSAAVWLDIGDQVSLRPNGVPITLDGNSAFTGVKISWINKYCFSLWKMWCILNYAEQINIQWKLCNATVHEKVNKRS